ncbi:MAG: hypothetical protein ABIX12_11045, partial [Rubrivivax sp.]
MPRAAVGSGAHHARAGVARALAAGALLAGAAVLPAAAVPERAVAPLTLTPCRLPNLEHEALCGRLTRPLDPDRPDATPITLRIAVVPAVA